MGDALTVRAEATDASPNAPCACCRPPSDANEEIRELQAQQEAVARRLAELDDRRV